MIRVWIVHFAILFEELVGCFFNVCVTEKETRNLQHIRNKYDVTLTQVTCSPYLTSSTKPGIKELCRYFLYFHIYAHLEDIASKMCIYLQQPPCKTSLYKPKVKYLNPINASCNLYIAYIKIGSFHPYQAQKWRRFDSFSQKKRTPKRMVKLYTIDYILARQIRISSYLSWWVGLRRVAGPGTSDHTRRSRVWSGRFWRSHEMWSDPSDQVTKVMMFLLYTYINTSQTLPFQW